MTIWKSEEEAWADAHRYSMDDHSLRKEEFVTFVKSKGLIDSESLDEVRPELDDKWFEEADAFVGDKLVSKGKKSVDLEEALSINSPLMRELDKIIRNAADSFIRQHTRNVSAKSSTSFDYTSLTCLEAARHHLGLKPITVYSPPS